MQINASINSTPTSVASTLGASIQAISSNTTANFCSALDSAFSSLSPITSDKTLSEATVAKKSTTSKNIEEQSTVANSDQKQSSSLKGKDNTDLSTKAKEDNTKGSKVQSRKEDSTKKVAQNSQDNKDVKNETNKEVHAEKECGLEENKLAVINEDVSREEQIDDGGDHAISQENIVSKLNVTNNEEEQINTDLSSSLDIVISNNINLEAEILTDVEVIGGEEQIEEIAKLDSITELKQEDFYNTGSVKENLGENINLSADRKDKINVATSEVLTKTTVSTEVYTQDTSFEELNKTEDSFMDLMKISRSANVDIASSVPTVSTISASTTVADIVSQIIDPQNSQNFKDETLDLSKIVTDNIEESSEIVSEDLVAMPKNSDTLDGNKVITNNQLKGTNDEAIAKNITASLSSGTGTLVSTTSDSSVASLSGSSFAEHLKTIAGEKSSGEVAVSTGEMVMQVKASSSSEYGTLEVDNVKSVGKITESFGTQTESGRSMTSTTVEHTVVNGTDFKAQLQDKMLQGNEQLQKTMHLSKNMEENVRQLSEKIGIMMAKNLKEAEINLDPVGLGKMKITVNVSDEGIARVNMVVQQSETRDLVNDSLSRLKTYMEQQGLLLGESSVEQHQSWGDRSQNNRSNQTNDTTSDKIGDLVEGSSDGEEIVFNASLSEQTVDYFA